MQPSGDSRGGEAPTELMDSGEYVSTVDNMDPTLAELGDEFTLGDIDGESVEQLWRLNVFSFARCPCVSAQFDSSPAERK